MKAANTKTRHVAIQMSLALVKELAGVLLTRAELCVVTVRMVRILRDVLAGVESASIQKLNQLKTTTSKDGR